MVNADGGAEVTVANGWSCLHGSRRAPRKGGFLGIMVVVAHAAIKSWRDECSPSRQSVNKRSCHPDHQHQSIGSMELSGNRVGFDGDLGDPAPAALARDLGEHG